MVNKMQMPSDIFVSGDNSEENHGEWGERPTFLMTEVLHRQLLIKSLSTTVSYTQSRDHEVQCGNNKPQVSYYFTLVTSSYVKKIILGRKREETEVIHFQWKYSASGMKQALCGIVKIWSEYLKHEEHIILNKLNTYL